MFKLLLFTQAMNKDISDYNHKQKPDDKVICDTLADFIGETLTKAESKIWYGSPVWFMDGNPIVGYHKLKECVRLLFWSGQSFAEEGLTREGSFKAAGKRYTSFDQIDEDDLKRWLKKATEVQWDYKNIVKRKGKLVRLK